MTLKSLWYRWRISCTSGSEQQKYIHKLVESGGVAVLLKYTKKNSTDSSLQQSVICTVRGHRQEDVITFLCSQLACKAGYDASGVRAAARDALRDTVTLDQALCVYSELLRHDKYPVTVEAADALGELQDARAIPILVEAVEFKDRYVCDYVSDHAARSLVKIADQAACGGLRSILQSSVNKNAIEKAAWVLGELRDGESRDLLAAKLNDGSAKLRRVVASALAKLGDSRAREELYEVLRSYLGGILAPAKKRIDISNAILAPRRV